MSEEKIIREEVRVSHVCISGRGWGESNAIPVEQAETILARIGDVEHLTDQGCFRWRVTLDKRLDTIGAGNGETRILIRDSSLRNPSVGSVAFFGVTSLDLEKLNSELGIDIDGI